MKRINLKNQNFQELKIWIKKITIGKDYFLVLEKIVLGIISHSSFMWINALYSYFFQEKQQHIIYILLLELQLLRFLSLDLV